MLKSQTDKWAFPKVSYCNLKKEFPNMGENCFIEWFNISRYWGGRIINLNIKCHQISLDFRKNWVADMIRG